MSKAEYKKAYGEYRLQVREARKKYSIIMHGVKYVDHKIKYHTQHIALHEHFAECLCHTPEFYPQTAAQVFVSLGFVTESMKAAIRKNYE